MIKRKEFSQDAPFIYTSRTTRTIYLSILILLLPQLLLLFLYHDLYAILNIFSATTATLICQSIVYYMEKSTFKIPLEALLQGLFIGFFMPTNIGFLFVFVCAFLGFSLTRVIFGKAGRWVHSTIFALLIAYISYPELFIFTQNILKSSGKSIFSSITSFLNSYILNEMGVSLPENYISMFWNSSAPIPACRYNILTILSSIIFLSLKIYDYTISATFIFVYSTLVYCMSKTGVTPFFSGDILAALLNGALLFMLFFAYGEPQSFPKTFFFRIVSGIFLALFSFIVSGGEASFVTLSFATLLLNILSPSIEEIERAIRFSKQKEISVNTSQ